MSVSHTLHVLLPAEIEKLSKDLRKRHCLVLSTTRLSLTFAPTKDTLLEELQEHLWKLFQLAALQEFPESIITLAPSIQTIPNKGADPKKEQAEIGKEKDVVWEQDKENNKTSGKLLF